MYCLVSTRQIRSWILFEYLHLASNVECPTDAKWRKSFSRKTRTSIDCSNDTKQQEICADENDQVQ